MRHFISDTRASAAGHRSGGGVIIVVLALLTSLMFLGIIFYEFSSQEKNAAEAGSRSRERDDQVDLPYAQAAEQAVEQLLVGATMDPTLSPVMAPGSVTPMWNFDSMLADMIGRPNVDGSLIDTAPHSGRGVAIWATADNNGDGYPDAGAVGEILFDYDGDGAADWDGSDSSGSPLPGFILNLSPAANQGFASGAFDTGLGNDAGGNPLFIDFASSLETDQGYTYPDGNSLWLAFDGYVGGVRVIKPSFFFPQYFPQYRADGTFSVGTYPGLVYDPDTVRQIMHPHALHVAHPDTDGDGVPQAYRFLTVATPAQSGDTSRILPPFPFEVDADNDGNFGEMGVWTNSGNDYDLPVDADGDGTPDSVRIDPGNDIVDLPGGRQVVPMVAFKIIELDGLFDLNSHGIPATLTALSNPSVSSLNAYNDIYGATQFNHFSGWGFSPSEINPLVGLLGDPTAITDPDEWQRATLPHRGMYEPPLGGAPAGLTFSRGQMANTEFAQLLYGRFEFYMDGGGNLALVSSDPTDHHVGRWGRDNGVVSANLLYDFLTGAQGSAPSPGVINLDDDGDDNDNSNNGAAGNGDYPDLEFADGGDGGRPLAQNSATLTPATRPVATPPVVHPLNTTALSNDLQPDPTGTSVGAVPVLASDGSSPMVYKQYDPTSFPQSQGGLTVHGVSSYDLALGGFLQPVGYDGLLNEPDEVILEPSLANGYDAPFGFEELAGLHWSENDWDRYGHTSRLRQLMPYNFDVATTPVPASYIRSQYSVSNVDRLEFGHHRYQDATNSRLWEFNDYEDYDNDGIDDGDGEDLDGDGVVAAGPPYDVLRFPPRFTIGGALLASRHDLFVANGLNTYYFVPADPFRPEVRRLLTVEAFDGTPGRPAFPQHRLNINRILADDQISGGPAAYDSYGNPQYRQLVPHPAEGNGGTELAPGAAVDDMIHEHTDPIPYGWGAIAGNPTAQEWWARYDRQRLARDIFVLLYTVGAPDSMGGSSFNPTTTPYATGDANSNSIDDMVEAMAQFAVNFVDQVDRDSVITKFEYDDNLSDGWTNAGATRVAFGVEHQQLVFGEVMYIQNDIDTSDHATTLHDDRNDTHRWLHVELRNASPFPVDMKEETWRLARMTPGTTTIEAAVDFGNAANYRTVAAGQNILISMHDGTVANADGEIVCSDFYADYTGGTELESVLPDNGTTIVDDNQDPDPTTDIDLCDPLRATPTGHDSYFQLLSPQPVGTFTTLVAPVPSGGPVSEIFDLVLMCGRKTDTGGVANVEWIEVDRFAIASTDAEFGIAFNPSGDGQTENDTALTALQSRERRQPFDERPQDNPGATPPLNHSMVTGANKHAANDYWLDPANTLTTPLYPNFTCWQPHFDRDYASVIELLSLPLFGADDVVSQQYTNAATPDAPVLDYDYAAGLRFMNPDGDDGDPSTPPPGASDPWVNRWYRVLEFLEVRERTHDSLAERLQYLRRTYGRMNLNGIRHAHVLAGLIDDSYHIDVTNPTDPAQDVIDAGRDWYDELLRSRDGIDHITTLPLPGLPQARPFRNLSHINSVTPNQSEQDTILRSAGSAPLVAPQLDYFNLFEARSSNDLPINGGTDEVDYYTRNRLLGKVHNLTTNRSHLFACWIAVEFFEAHQIPVSMDADANPDTDGDGVPEGYATQVGGLAGDLPMRRMFCVIDRSRLEEAYDPTTGRFDFRQFIVYKRWID